MATIRAHFDGKVFVPDEPVDLPKDQPVTVVAPSEPQASGLAAADASQCDPEHDALIEALRRKHPWVGAWRGKIRMTEDFEAPLDDFKDYM